MRNLLVIIVIVGSLGLLSLPSLLAEPEPCITKQTRWCDTHQTQEHIWEIEGDPYLVSETPHEQFEILGLDRRFH